MGLVLLVYDPDGGCRGFRRWRRTRRQVLKTQIPKFLFLSHFFSDFVNDLGLGSFYEGTHTIANDLGYNLNDFSFFFPSLSFSLFTQDGVSVGSLMER